MKKLIFLLSLIISGSSLIAQDVCSVYYPLDKGTTFQITTYNKKAKATAVLDYQVKDAGSDWALLTYDLKDDKGKSVATSEYSGLIRRPNEATLSALFAIGLNRWLI